MIVLAFDTSTNQGGVAVLKDRDVLARRVWAREKSHSETLTATIEDTLRDAGIGLSDVERLAVGRGPGSFTGIRVAINAARALAYARALPIHAFDTTEILAASVPVLTSPLLVAVNAHKNLLYVSRFAPRAGRWSRERGPEALTIGELEESVVIAHVCVGDGYDEFASVLPPGLKARLSRDSRLSDAPDPVALGRLAFESRGAPLVWNELQALYIRSSEAEEQLRERLKNRPD